MKEFDENNVEKLVEKFFSDAKKKGIDKAIKTFADVLLGLSDEVDMTELSQINEFIDFVTDVDIYLEEDFYKELEKDISEFPKLSNILSNASLAGDLLTKYYEASDEEKANLLVNAQIYYEMLIAYIELTSLGKDDYLSDIEAYEDTLSYGELEIIRFIEAEEFIDRIVDEYSQYDDVYKAKALSVISSFKNEKAKNFLSKILSEDSLTAHQKAMIFHNIFSEDNKMLIDIAEQIHEAVLPELSVVQRVNFEMSLEVLKNGKDIVYNILVNSDNKEKQFVSIQLMNDFDKDKKNLHYAFDFLIKAYDTYTEWNDDEIAIVALTIKIVVESKTKEVLELFERDNDIKKLILFLSTMEHPALTSHLVMFFRFNLEKTFKLLVELLNDRKPKEQEQLYESRGIEELLVTTNHELKRDGDYNCIVYKKEDI